MLTDEATIAKMRAEANRTRVLERDEEADLLRRIHDPADAAAMRALLAAHLRLVVSLASRYRRGGLSGADLVAEGNLGLVEAARRFDASKDVRFATYAAFWIRGRIGRFVLANRRIVAAPSTRNARKLFAGLREAERGIERTTLEPATRAAVAERTGTTEDDVAMVESALSGHDVPLDPQGDGLEWASEERSPEELVSAREESEHLVRAVGRALSLLDRRERAVAERRLLDPGDDRKTLAEVGHELGLSRERVRQIELSAKQKLCAALRDAA